MNTIEKIKKMAQEAEFIPDEAISDYDHYLKYLIDDDELETIALLILSGRTSIYKRWSSFSDEQKLQVNELDKRLFEKRDLISYLMPHPSFPDKKMWWMHLHDADVVKKTGDELFGKGRWEV